MTSKAFTNVLKLAPIYSCGRQMVTKMEEMAEDLIEFEVTKADVAAAWEVVKLSMFAYRQFKVLIFLIT